MIKPFIDVVGESAFAQLWQVTLVVAAAALVTHFACARRAHLAHLVWLMVLIKCLTPPLWSSPTGVFSWAMQRSPADAKRTALAATSNSTARAERPANLIDQGPGSANLPAAGDRPAASEAPMTSPAAAMQQGPLGSADISRQAIRLLLLAWAAGAAAYAGFAILVAVGSWRAVRRSRCPDDESASALLARLARRLDVRRRVRLLLVNEPLGPMTFGWMRPAIIVPEQLIVGRPAAEVEPLLAHELIHVRRGDALVGLLQLAAQCVWWFHPLVWWANREIGRERERCCDEEVVAGLACPPATYARSLLNVLELKRQLRWLGPLPGLRPFEVTKQRLERLMTHSAEFRPRMPRAYWLLLLAGVLVIGPGGSLARSTEESPANAPKSNASVDRSRPNDPGPSRSGSHAVTVATAPSQNVVATARITGRVTDSAGNPLSGAKVVWNLASGGRIDLDHTPNTATSDKTGRYELTLRFQRGETLVIHEMFADLDGYVRAAPVLEIPLTDGKEGKQDFRLEKGEVLGGVLRRPPKRVDDNLPKWPPKGPILFTVTGPNLSPRPNNALLYTTDPNGRFAIYLPHGEYTLTPSMYRPGTKEWTNLRTGQRDLVLQLPESPFGPKPSRETASAELEPSRSSGGTPTPTRKTVAAKSRRNSEFPRLIESVPQAGQSDVSPDLKEIRVTFDRDMGKGMSWTGSPESFYPPGDENLKVRWINARTCVLPVKLEKGKYYRVGINSTGYRNFRSARGVSFPPSVVYFTTEGASAEVRNRLRVPKIVELKPANGASDVDPSITELRVTFDIPMGEGMSWTGAGPRYPGRSGARAEWSDDHKTCILPASLRPGHSYGVGLNDINYNNFQSESGVPLEPVFYRFKTR
jgi:beta-lactamase regulating signal transducer with metallopeptidase domain